MKFYQDSGFKWTVASTLVLASIIGMTTFAANAAPPLANPPGGNISPSFTSLAVGTDVIVGQNVKVGGDIRSTTGGSFALNAPKVNFTNDIEAKGNINGLSVTTNTINSIINKLSLIGDISINKTAAGVAGSLTVDKLTIGKDAQNNSSLKITDQLNDTFELSAQGMSMKRTFYAWMDDIHNFSLDHSGIKMDEGPGGVNGSTITQDKIDIYGPAKDTYLTSSEVNTTGTITGNSIVSNGNIDATAGTGTITGNSIVSNGNIDATAGTGTITGKSIVSNGNIDATAGTGTITGKSIVSNGNIDATAGTITGQTITSTGPLYGNNAFITNTTYVDKIVHNNGSGVNIEGMVVKPSGNVAIGNVYYPYNGTPVIDGAFGVNGKIRASSIGTYATAVGVQDAWTAPATGPNSTAQAVSTSCPTNYKVLSCEGDSNIGAFIVNENDNKMYIPGRDFVVSGSSIIGNGSTCKVYFTTLKTLPATIKSAPNPLIKKIIFRANATCFSPNY